MARRYYNTVQRVYQLLLKHPAMNQMLNEFSIPESGVKEVAEFLINNDEKISTYELHTIYNWPTSNTIERDQPSPLAIYVDTYDDLPESPDPERTYYVTNPHPGTYYEWDGSDWVVDSDYETFTTDEYIKYQQETGHLIWEDERGYFMLVEENGIYSWDNLGENFSGTVNGSLIRKGNLPMSGVDAGDVYYVKGEDLMDILAVLYGFTPPDYYPPWDQYVSPYGTNLLELLKFTIYYYRYATIDNFYEKHIFDFIPEYDRNDILSKPKMKLFLEGIGRNLDNLEDKVSRIPDLYDIDECPEELLDYLGQMLGYEREDFTLADISFRELLKNIIEIYKIKGTNYSFSFFFKFLGFNVNLKEFYFNRNVTNPESFPGIDENNVEYYLTTQNPIFETGAGGPAEHLEQIRDLNEWDVELQALLSGGCTNPVLYMLGFQTYNEDGTTWHANPWTFFKTNLIEYQLDPFLTKVNLTASDNKTIRKYIRFLSPTYLFTWVNINLQPWADSYDVFTEMEEHLMIELEKTMGDWIDPDTGQVYIYNDRSDYLTNIRDGNYEFQDGEKMEDYLEIYNEDGEQLIFSITNFLDFGGGDVVGAVLRRDGVHIRQPGHPSYIDNIRHDGTLKLNFDNLNVFIKDTTEDDFDYTVATFGDLPTGPAIDDIAYVEDEQLYYIYKQQPNYWEEYTLQPGDTVTNNVNTYQELMTTTGMTDGDIYRVYETDTYYIYHVVPPEWVQASLEDRLERWNDFSYRPFPAVPISVQPQTGITVDTNNPQLIWEDINHQIGFNIQVTNGGNFNTVILDEELPSTTTTYTLTDYHNDTYYWRIRVKNILNDWGEWSNIFYFVVEALPFPFDGEIISHETNYVIADKDIGGSVIGASFTIKWPRIYNIDVYQLQISLESTFNTTLFDVEIQDNQYNVSLDNGQTYYWKYRAKKFGSWLSWNGPYTFEIDF